MAVIKGKPTVNLSVTLQLKEDEARALEFLASFNQGDVLEVFSAKLSPALVSDHGDGWKSLLASARQSLPRLLSQAQRARKLFEGREDATD